MDANEHGWCDIAVFAEHWWEVLSSARAKHAEGTLFRTKHTNVTVETEADDGGMRGGSGGHDVNLSEEDDDPDADENAYDQEKFPAREEGLPTAVPPPLASDSIWSGSRLMALDLVCGDGSAQKRV